MSLKNVTIPEVNVRLIEFGCDRATFDAAVNEVYKVKIKKMSVPGFRPGKAPLSFVEKMYGKIFYEDAIQKLIPSLYTDALKEAELYPISDPEFDIVELNEEGLVLSAKFYVKPEIEIEGYKGITVTKTEVEVTDEAVESEIQKKLEASARSIEVTDRPAALGDTVLLDYSGSVDGVAFEGGTAQGHSLELGSGSFIPGFEDQIVGKNIDEEFDVNVTFPEDYNATELAGKAAVFVCTIHSITVKELPELDDSFAADVSEFDTLDEYRADVKRTLIEEQEHAAEHATEDQLEAALAELVVGEIPEVMYQRQLDSQIENIERRFSSQGFSLDMYCQFTGTTRDAVIEQIKPDAIKHVKVGLALEKIAKLEGLTASDDEVEAKYQEIADNYKMEIDQVKAAIAKEDLVAEILNDKALALVKENAATVEATEAPADTVAEAASEAPAESEE